MASKNRCLIIMENWKSLRTICMVERERQFEDRTECESACYIGSIDRNAEPFARAIRSRRAVVNSLHGVLDVSFREDGRRVGKDNAAENVAVLRHVALNMIKKKRS